MIGLIEIVAAEMMSHFEMKIPKYQTLLDICHSLSLVVRTVRSMTCIFEMQDFSYSELVGPNHAMHNRHKEKKQPNLCMNLANTIPNVSSPPPYFFFLF